MPPITWQPKFETSPPKPRYCVLSYPAPSVLLVRLDRPKALNCINSEGNFELDAIWNWLDQEPTLRSTSEGEQRQRPDSGFGGLSRRGGRKPVIAAVNGLCLGGGCEMIVNCDIILASSRAIFALLEVKRGVVAFAGALPRIVRTIGRPRAMEMALTGRDVTAAEAAEWGLINKVVKGEEERAVIDEAIEYAKMIAVNSPDSVIVSREGIKLGWEGNIKEGLKAFVEKRKPKWKAAKL
ncbi:ClpP/crotonase-like domain-containing protein [Delphinella strobiligena]|nr:ClpP/crotonase-like domain-containing protein [Delphinella strobiligena]